MNWLKFLGGVALAVVVLVMLFTAWVLYPALVVKAVVN